MQILSYKLQSSIDQSVSLCTPISTLSLIIALTPISSPIPFLVIYISALFQFWLLLTLDHHLKASLKIYFKIFFKPLLLVPFLIALLPFLKISPDLPTKSSYQYILPIFSMAIAQTPLWFISQPKKHITQYTSKSSQWSENFQTNSESLETLSAIHLKTCQYYPPTLCNSNQQVAIHKNTKTSSSGKRGLVLEKPRLL